MDKPIFKFDDDQPDFKKLLEKAKNDPSSTSMSELESKAEDYIRDLGNQYSKMSLEDIAKKQDPDKVSVRAEADAYLFVSEPLITEIWMLDLTEKQVFYLYSIFRQFGGEVMLRTLLSDGVLIAPHKMLLQKFRQLHAGWRADGSLQFWIYWSDEQLPDDLLVIVREQHAEGLHRRPVYYVPTVEAAVLNSMRR